MADDIVTSGGRPPGRDEALESLFYARYPQLVQTAFGLAGDWAVAEHLAQEAFARLWRRRRAIRDRDAAAYLDRTVTSLADSAGREPEGAQLAGAQPAGAQPAGAQPAGAQPAGARPAQLRRQVDVDQAWRQFQRRRQQAGRPGGRRLPIAAAVVVAIVVAAVVAIVIATSMAGRPQNGHPGALPSAGTPPGSRHRVPPAARNYPDSITARVPVRNVVSMAGQGGDVWALTFSGELARISARTNRVTLSVHVPGVTSGGQLAAGHGTLWLDACRSSGQALLLGIDPATGRVRARIGFPGSCGSIAYGRRHLWVVSGVRGGIRILRINPATRRVDASTGTIHSLVYSFVAGPEGIWYSTGSRIRQVDPSGTRLGGVTVNDSSYPFTLIDAELALGHGAVWALSGDENIARIDPATGGITALISYRSFDPTYAFTGGPFIDVGQDSLWLLADLAHTQVLRVSMSTGQPQGRVRVGGSCGQPCSQIYDVAGAVWVPSGSAIVRIDPARVAG